MELDWLQSLAMGLFSGLTDILPVSSQAHQALLLEFFGASRFDPLLRLVIHVTTLITLLGACWGQIGRIRRQLRIGRIPRRHRNRPVDLAALMDAKILKTALVPIVLCLLLYGLTAGLSGSLLWISAASLLNAVILYLPGVFPTADKDSRLVTPGESLQMGLGAGAAVLPGISSVGAAYSAGILHGMDRGYMIHLSLFMHMMFTLGMIVYDVLGIVNEGVAVLNGNVFLCCAAAAASTVAGTILGLRMMRSAAEKSGLTAFSFYSFGVAVFTFILYLVV